MEQVVAMGQAEPALKHESAAVFTAAFAAFSKFGVGSRPPPLRKGQVSKPSEAKGRILTTSGSFTARHLYRMNQRSRTQTGFS